MGRRADVEASLPGRLRVWAEAKANGLEDGSNNSFPPSAGAGGQVGVGRSKSGKKLGRGTHITFMSSSVKGGHAVRLLGMLRGSPCPLFGWRGDGAVYG